MSPASSFVIVLTTWPLDVDVTSFARTIVDERLVACVNILAPMQSVYRWKGGVEEGSERQLLMKTAADRLDALKARLAKLHPYEVPEILVIPVSGGGNSYLTWLTEAIQPSPSA